MIVVNYVITGPLRATIMLKWPQWKLVWHPCSELNNALHIDEQQDLSAELLPIFSCYRIVSHAIHSR